MGVLGGNIPPPRAKARSAGPPAAASLLVTPKRPRGGGVSDPVELFAIPIVGDPMLPMLPAVPHSLYYFNFQIFFFVWVWRGVRGVAEYPLNLFSLAHLLSYGKKILPIFLKVVVYGNSAPTLTTHSFKKEFRAIHPKSNFTFSP